MFDFTNLFDYKKNSIKSYQKFSLCKNFSQEIVIPILFSNEISYLYFQIVQQTKIFRKLFENNRLDFMTDYIKKLLGKNVQKSTVLVISFHEGH